jgi:hypothetical protein
MVRKRSKTELFTNVDKELASIKLSDGDALNRDVTQEYVHSPRGILLGNFLLNYIGNFCSETFMGAMQGECYIEGHCIGV